MCNPQPVNAGILLDSSILISILGYYLGWCFDSNYEVIEVQECSRFTHNGFVSFTIELYAISMLTLFLTLEIMK
jgi:hypothetical protein